MINIYYRKMHILVVKFKHFLKYIKKIIKKYAMKEYIKYIINRHYSLIWINTTGKIFCNEKE